MVIYLKNKFHLFSFLKKTLEESIDCQHIFNYFHHICLCQI